MKKKATNTQAPKHWHLGHVTIDGHAYPADPTSETFTDLLMGSFQHGRDASAANQRQTMPL
jgi:hypothetical protein